MDWFCSLPDGILTCILSFLSTKEAVQTCILSKKWRHAWAFLPVLKFDITDWLDEENLRECELKFKNFLYGVLENREPTVQLDMFEYENYIPDYDSEISFEFLDSVALLEPRVVSVDIGRGRVNQLDLPDSIFSCTRLENLDLCIFTENFPVIRPESVHLPSLKNVDLTGIALTDDDRFIQNLCSSECPVLETMVLELCDLDISEISSRVLKELTIYDCSQSRLTRISCPCLSSLIIESYEKMAGFELKNTTSLEYAKICLDLDKKHGDLYLLSSLSNVSHLSLGLWGPQFKVKLEKDILKCRTFRNLQTLEIYYWDLSYDIDLVACFLEHSPFLEELTLLLREPKEGDPKEELSQDELRNRRNVLFQRERLKTVRIVKPIQRPDMVVDQLINYLRTHIKTIEEEIIS
ncbi:F-box/FBD/LRR-repeat protein [Carex littledalei]|uniref:F-box/FBD/LRR-repeat protein n=1 Tax=Carex littledalei TaxID=544730 RepID=A0A833R1V5_9POAL|nr:F-box/FBD/LRR-repeat protein [Carex littledalei]